MDRNALSRATEATSAPTPGYLYVDISKNAATSPQTSLEIVKYLSRRLTTKSNPNVKHKCLRVLTKVATDPLNRGMFKRAVVQDHEAVAAIKACLNFRGPPDAARGDQPYEQVRQAAKECLDAVYSDTPSSSAGAGGGGGAMGGAGGMSMQGIGGGGMGGAYGAPVAGSGAGGMSSMGPPGSAPPGAHPHATRRMEGIGSHPYPTQGGGGIAGSGVTKDQLKSMVATAAEGFKGIINDPLARNVPGVGVGGGGSGIGGGSGGGSYGGPQNYGNPPGRSELTAATNGQWTMASNRGPNAVGAAPQFAHAAASAAGAGAGAGSTSGIAAANRGVGGSWGAGGAAPSASGMGVGGAAVGAVGGGGGGFASPAIAAAPPPAAPAMGTGTAGASASDGSYERNLVMELCPPGGMKAEPPLEKLVAFLRAIPSLEADLVCPVLLDCLDDGQPWIIKAKALCVIEKTIVTAEEQGLDAYSAFFHACAEEIQPLAVHNRSAIHNPARRVLKALGLDAAYSTAGGAAPPVRAQKAPAAAPAVAEAPNLLDFDEPAAAPAPAPVGAAPVPVMLGGDDVPAAAPAPAAPAAAPAAAGGDMFGGLTTKDKAAPAPAAAAPAAPVANGGGDLFGDMQVKPSTSTETPVENGTAVPAAPAPASGGSAFGFMNATANDSAPAPAAPAPAAAAPAPTPAAPAASPKPGDAGFDPLLSLSAPSEPTAEEKVAKTQAQIAQMQAMQYQQQMMMMQQQMAQMQMAMAGGGVPQSPRPATHAAAGASAGVNANVMSAHNSTATTGFSFLDNASSAAQEAQKKKNAAFNFVMDDMKKG